MGIDRLRALLRRHAKVALDSSVFIYHLENNVPYVSFTKVVFSWLEQPRSQAVTSTITMTEVLVHPYRELEERRVGEYYALLSTYPNLTWIPADLEIASIAAQIRAQHGLRTPDALQAATALHAHATCLITNDPVFTRIDGYETVVLDRLTS